MATKPAIEYLGCPPEFLPLRTADNLSADAGYFHFGPDITCYGRSSAGGRSAEVHSPLYDTLLDSITASDRLLLPFDLVDVIDNLRFERYVRQEVSTISRLLKAGYSLARPILSVSVRKHLQRYWLRGWNNVPFPHFPVDTTVERIIARVLALCMNIQSITRVPFIWFWPNGAEGALMMTHDVETAAGQAFCSDLMTLDSSFGLRSSFQVIPEGRYQVSGAFLNSIRSRGFELNIHDLNHDGNLYRDYRTFLRRSEHINRYAQEFAAKGFRAGVLYRNLNWYGDLHFLYDMSVPNVAHLDPQHGGCCTVMPYHIGQILELPLTTMQDYTLFIILGQYSCAIWESQISCILQAHGLISFNIHPDYIIPSRARECYVSLLEHICRLRDDKRIWVATPGEVAEWWEQRSRMRVVNRGGNWEVRGSGADRARLAWAVLQNNDTVYVNAT